MFLMYFLERQNVRYGSTEKICLPYYQSLHVTFVLQKRFYVTDVNFEAERETSSISSQWSSMGLASLSLMKTS